MQLKTNYAEKCIIKPVLMHILDKKRKTMQYFYNYGVETESGETDSVLFSVVKSK